jgi:hypothetical protein
LYIKVKYYEVNKKSILQIANGAYDPCELAQGQNMQTSPHCLIVSFYTSFKQYFSHVGG